MSRSTTLAWPCSHPCRHGLAPPKAIADIAESLLGAVFVDAGFSLAAAQGVFDRFFLPFIKRYVSPATAVIASSKTLASMLHSRGCTDWLVDFVDEPAAPSEAPPVGLFDSAPQGGTSVVRCRLVCHGKVLADATGKSEYAAAAVRSALIATCRPQGRNDRVRTASGSRE